MQIAIAHHGINAKGGMETYLYNLLDEFAEQQDQVLIHIYQKVVLKNLSYSYKRYNLNFLPRVMRKLIFGRKVHKYIATTKHDFSISLMRAVKQDVIICGGTHLGFLAHVGKAPGFFDRLEIKLEQASYRSAGIIVAHSHLLREELIELYQVPENKIVTLYPPVDTKKFHQSYRSYRAEIRSRYKINPNKIAILFPSTGHKRKGFFLLLEAMKKLPASEFELVVAGDEISNKELATCHYVGFVENMAELYSACDATILPSYYEPFGLVITESLQCGTPVILSEFVGAKDLITPEQGIKIEQLSPDSIADAIMKLKVTKFTIKENWATDLGLTVSDHIHTLKSHCLKMRSNYEAEKDKS